MRLHRPLLVRAEGLKEGLAWARVYPDRLCLLDVSSLSARRLIISRLQTFQTRQRLRNAEPSSGSLTWLVIPRFERSCASPPLLARLPKTSRSSCDLRTPEMDVASTLPWTLFSLLLNAVLLAAAFAGCAGKKAPPPNQSAKDIAVDSTKTVPPAPSVSSQAASAAPAPPPATAKAEEKKEEKPAEKSKIKEKSPEKSKASAPKSQKEVNSEVKKEEEKPKTKSKNDEKDVAEKPKDEKPKSEKKSEKQTKSAKSAKSVKTKKEGVKDADEEGDGYEACPEMTAEQLAKIAEEAGK
ncbi:hypothetical protein L596_025480 [Steinernema carpocapsae]|uniref:Uncharacterized protein n=1 Tax=Steinernema carpocapsae TaxID=34508 RepID=A0A4U5M7X1_STECR|nr:hypothetical protein L596_025480 [Steinernema carpocapsae]